jgi:hypothetical protein
MSPPRHRFLSLCSRGALLCALLLGLCLSGAGCSGGRGGLPFRLETGEGSGERRLLGPDAAGSYRLAEPVMVPETGQALYLRYRGEPGGAELVAFDPSGRSIARRPLPPASGYTLRLELPLLPGEELAGLAVAAPTVGEAGGEGPGAGDSAEGSPPGSTFPQSLRLLEAGLGRARGGLERSGELLSLGAQIDGYRERGGTVEIALSADAFGAGALGEDAAAGVQAGAGWELVLAVRLRAPVAWGELRAREALGPGEPAPGPLPGGRATALIRLVSGSRELTLRYRGLAGPQRLVLPAGLLSFRPQTLTLQAEAGADLWLESLRIEGGAPAPLAPLVPVAADPGAILLYRRASWRDPEYELFQWSRYPQVLIVDTASYAVQSRFFKRLAFFAEKRGFRGRLLPDEQLTGRHGYNAHDYRAEDLARFFQQAAEQRFPLSPEEQLLKRILVRNGVILEGQSYLPGQGAILSISRETPESLRARLLTHECFHGLFFALPAYRQACGEAWAGLSPAELGYWGLLFRWMGYDTEAADLAVNEFQAYLFQQPRWELDGYFRGLTAGRLLSSYPEQGEGLRRFLGADPESFRRSFDRLEAPLKRAAGLEGAGVIELLPASY